MEKVESLEKLVLNRNRLQKLENIGSFPNLRELSAENNLIADLGGLSECTKLVKLELGSNKIRKIDGVMDNLKKL